MVAESDRKGLSGLRVLEYGEFISAPYCTKLLADLGAEVIKVEKPRVGDNARHVGPFVGDNPQGESLLFLYLNTNKLGITLDLTDSWGARILKKLVSEADVVVESSQPGTMESLGLDYNSLKSVNRKLIMVAISPFGQTGPYRHFKATDLISYCMAGYAHITPSGGVENPEVEHPLRAGGLQTEFTAGVMAAVAAMSGVFARLNDGEGHYIDVSQQEALCGEIVGNLYGFLYSREPRTRFKGGHLGSLAILPARDGYVSYEMMQETQWNSLLELMGHPDWVELEMFRDRAHRAANWDVVEKLLAEWSAQYSKEELLSQALEKRIPCSSINTPADVANSEQLAARQFFVEFAHPAAGVIRYPSAPYRFSRTPWGIERPAPSLGEHNQEILGKRLGYKETDLRQMRHMGVI